MPFVCEDCEWETDAFEVEEKSSPAEQLEDIKEHIERLLDFAHMVMVDAVGSDSSTFERAKGYWYAHIRCALDNDHMYLGGSMTTMEDTIKELQNLSEDKEEDKD